MTELGSNIHSLTLQGSWIAQIPTQQSSSSVLTISNSSFFRLLVDSNQSASFTDAEWEVNNIVLLWSELALARVPLNATMQSG